jgi:hypothetical protein
VLAYMLCKIVLYFSNIRVFIWSEFHVCFVLILVFREMVAYIANTLIFILRYWQLFYTHGKKISLWFCCLCPLVQLVWTTSCFDLMLRNDTVVKFLTCEFPSVALLLQMGFYKIMPTLRGTVCIMYILKFTSICPLGRGRVFPI